MSTMQASAPEFVPRPSSVKVKPEAATSSSSSSKPVNNRKRPLANPSMVPQQPRVPKTAQEKESTRRLYIVLSQACLETYQLSGGGPSGAARRDGRYDSGREERYTLLNCDDHVSRASTQMLLREEECPLISVFYLHTLCRMLANNPLPTARHPQQDEP